MKINDLTLRRLRMLVASLLIVLGMELLIRRSR